MKAEPSRLILPKPIKDLKLLFGYHRFTIRYVCVRAHRSAALQVATIGVARGGQGAMPPVQFLEYLVISCFERRYPKQNTVDRLKSNILAHRLQLTSLLQFKFCIVCVRTKFCLLCYATVETLLLLTKGPMKIKSCTTFCETNFKKREGQSLASARQLEMSGSLVGRQKSAHGTTRVPCS